MSTCHAVHHSRIPAFLDALSALPGFICLGAGPDQHRYVSALPRRQWWFDDDARGFAGTVADILQAHRKIAGPGRCAAIAGSLCYEAGRQTVPGYHSERPLSDPLGWAGLYLWQLELPAAGGSPRLWFDQSCPEDTRQHVLELLERSPGRAPVTPFRMTTDFTARTSAGDYRSGVDRILDYIGAGDCYQVNLSQHFEGGFEGSPWFAWRALIEDIPVPHGGFLDCGPWQLLSVSPELFLDISDHQVTSKPIKGTRPRSKDTEQDQALARALANSPKDRAENLMIVDLIRNDLSHFCEPFSVRVPRLFNVESYRNVHQLVSTVTGTLQAGITPFEAMLSAFPGGSITGAPKRRAMEIIDELEPHTRGPYCGTLFRWGADDRLQSNIAIRSLQSRADGVIRAWAGCGIVADSDPEDEFRESLSKIQRLLSTLESLG